MHSMRLCVSWLAVLLFACGINFAQTSTDNEQQAVRKVVAEYMKARNNKDANAVQRLFTPDADQLVSTGEWRRGLAELVRGTSASSRKEAGRSSISIEDVRFLDENVAIADGRYQTVSLAGAKRNMWTTIILKRVGDTWKIAAIRNMLPAPSH